MKYICCKIGKSRDYPGTMLMSLGVSFQIKQDTVVINARRFVSRAIEYW